MEAILGILFILGFPIATVVLAWKWYQDRAQLKLTHEANEKLKSELKQLKDKASPLWRYQGIADAQKEANNVLARAKAEAEAFVDRAMENIQTERTKAALLVKQAEGEIEKAKVEAEALRKDARNRASENKEKATEILTRAYHEADQVIAMANERAREIAGAALDAKEKSDLYEQKAKAMKNLIDGYGDEYLISARTLLDELAEDFSHKEGGVELMKARQLTKTLVTGERAATCDYVETNRRETAIRFVLDAFNGKIDTALSKVRHDNYGKLEQEIKDAFGLVNGHGQAFRSARITEEYLAARLAELKWATITQELRRQEQEEQRRIKEEMREEEKARREYEKAIQEAEKEERMLQKAMAEAQKHLAEASEEQRKIYEDQIADLRARYQEAEAKNQRAISMAQQTRRGHVYVISNIGSFGENVYKIGMTRRLEPLDRIRELGDASVPFAFDVHALIFAENAPSLEKELHRHFEPTQVNKINPRKEFFSVSIKDIKNFVEEKNIETHWTMLAEAIEYRESLSIEKKKSSINQFNVPLNFLHADTDLQAGIAAAD